MPDWEEMYQANETGWDRGEISPALTYWLGQEVFHNDALSLFVPGCGRGYEVIELAKRGFNVTGLDLAPSATNALKDALKEAGTKASVVCEDVFNYQPDAPFDLIYEQTCLCALPIEKRDDYEQCLYRFLKPGGRLLFSMMQTGRRGGPPFHCDLLDMHSLFHEDRWQWAEDAPVMIPRPKPSTHFELGFVLQRI